MPETSTAAPAEPGTNWAGNVAYRAARLHRPASLAELQSIVAGSERVKALGSRHCFNDIADTPADLVALDRLPGEVVLEPAPDGDGGTAWVPGGARYREVVPHLAEHGFALHNLASLPHITVAGATATGTHGSGNRNGSLSTAVVGLELVRADGELVRLAPGDPDFAGTVVHLGALGVVTRIALRYQPAFQVRTDVYVELTWERLFADFDAVADAAYSVSVFTDWREVTQVWVKARTDEHAVVPEEFFGARAATEPTHMLPGTPVENLTDQLGLPGEWHERLPHFRTGFTPSSGEELQTEYFVPRRHGREACEALRSLAHRITPLLQVSELRTVAADDLWLSPACGEEVLALHFTWLPEEERVRALLPAIEAALRPYGARPHWGKLFTTGADELAALYPRMGAFRELVRRFDPQGVFRNDYLDRTVAAFA
ncbi:xylitol oxidase [Blastococcus sp. DSM 46786]|uniref:D-arabinono-1,4-lactone oxidase n=1 Tax=Blastococcus sp. DSM 46786 TaxID=1798227 RepID=UPI0008C852C5|nr:D-arabinono-1,4-lactone oxidase [Blastococcus sp. DSM 46786]SEK57370.1 xylitol oxidase [Blastococcus sp. DSM 46786]